jgi:uncharacterized phage protein (predicted DNA packaging)
MIVALDDVKEHLNQLSDADDDLIKRKIAAAQNHVESLLGFKIEARFGGQDQDPVPPALIECVCQLAAHWYENREAALVGVNAQTLPFGVWDIVNEYRDWSWGQADV